MDREKGKVFGEEHFQTDFLTERHWEFIVSKLCTNVQRGGVSGGEYQQPVVQADGRIKHVLTTTQVFL